MGDTSSTTRLVKGGLASTRSTALLGRRFRAGLTSIGVTGSGFLLKNMGRVFCRNATCSPRGTS